MLPRPPACTGCPANATARGFVPPSGPASGVLLAIIGQGPGADEAAFGEPFIGESGRRLDRWLAQSGIPREQIAIGNIVQCQLPGNRPPHKREAQHCWRAHIRPWLESLGGQLRVVVPVGVPSMEVMISPDATASTAGTVHPIPQPWRGDPFVESVAPAPLLQPTPEGSPGAPDVPAVPQRDAPCPVDLPELYGEVGGAPGVADPADRGIRSGGPDGAHPAPVVAVPILHPAFIIRGQWAQEPAQVDFLRRAWDIARGRIKPDLSPLTEPPPGCNPTPTMAEILQFDIDTKIDEPVACDIEGTRGRLIGIGWCRLRDEQAIYIPILDGDKPYWTEELWPNVDKVIRRLLRRPLIFHNGSTFDIPFLESCGYEVPIYADDTMIRHHILYAEQPKGLEELAVRYCGMRAWKWLSHVETEDGK